MPTAFDQRGQTVHGSQINIAGYQHIHIAGNEQICRIPQPDSSGLRRVRIFVSLHRQLPI